MARSKKPKGPGGPEDDGDNVVIQFGPRARHQEATGTLMDPKLPLPGPIKRVQGQRPPKQQRIAVKDRYDTYLRLLRQFNGDPVPALAAVFNITEDEAHENATELHKTLVKGTDVDRPMDELLTSLDLTQPAVLGVIRRHLYSDHPAASLKAADMIRDMWGDSNVGESIEDLVRMALGESE